MASVLYTLVSVVHISSSNPQIIMTLPSFVVFMGIVRVFTVFNQTEAVKTPYPSVQTFQTVYCESTVLFTPTYIRPINKRVCPESTSAKQKISWLISL